MKFIILFVIMAISSLALAIISLVDHNALDINYLIPLQILLVGIMVMLYFELRHKNK